MYTVIGSYFKSFKIKAVINIVVPYLYIITDEEYNYVLNLVQSIMDYIYKVLRYVF